MEGNRVSSILQGEPSSIAQFATHSAGVFIDVNSLLRNLGALTGVAAKTIRVSSAAGGILGVVAGAMSTYRHGSAVSTSQDAEHNVHNTLLSVAGLASVAASGITMAEAIAKLKGVALHLGAAGPIAATAMFSLWIISSANSLRKLESFSRAFEKQGSDEAKIAWLKTQTDLDLVLDKETAELVKSFGVEGQKSKEPAVVVKAVEKSLFKEKLSHILTIFISLIGLTACALLLANPIGVLVPTILFAVSAALWLTVDVQKLNNWIGNKVYEVYEKYKGKPPLLDERDIIPMVPLDPGY